MREEDLLRSARPILNQLNEDEQIIGTSTEFIKDKNSYYLKCVTLLEKNTKNSKRISNIIKENTRCEPILDNKDGFSILNWKYFIK